MLFSLTFNIQGLFHYNLHPLNVVLVPDGIQKPAVVHPKWQYLCNCLFENEKHKNETSITDYPTNARYGLFLLVFPSNGRSCTFLHPSKSSAAAM